MIATPPPIWLWCGIDIDLYPGGHSSSGMVVSSSLIQVSVNVQRLMFLLEISTFKSADLLMIDLQFTVAQCRHQSLPMVLFTSCIVFRFAVLTLANEFRLPTCCCCLAWVSRVWIW